MTHEASGLELSRYCRHHKHCNDADVKVYSTSFWWHCADNCNLLFNCARLLCYAYVNIFILCNSLPLLLSISPSVPLVCVSYQTYMFPSILLLFQHMLNVNSLFKELVFSKKIQIPIEFQNKLNKSRSVSVTSGMKNYHLNLILIYLHLLVRDVQAYKNENQLRFSCSSRADASTL